jgi:hypothetical protein
LKRAFPSAVFLVATNVRAAPRFPERFPAHVSRNDTETTGPALPFARPWAKLILPATLVTYSLWAAINGDNL